MTVRQDHKQGRANPVHFGAVAIGGMAKPLGKVGGDVLGSFPRLRLALANAVMVKQPIGW